MVFWFMPVGIHSMVITIALFGHPVDYGTILMIIRLHDSLTCSILVFVIVKKGKSHQLLL
jgi:hypothetical protein